MMWRPLLEVKESLSDMAAAEGVSPGRLLERLVLDRQYQAEKCGRLEQELVQLRVQLDRKHDLLVEAVNERNELRAENERLRVGGASSDELEAFTGSVAGMRHNGQRTFGELVEFHKMPQSLQDQILERWREDRGVGGGLATVGCQTWKWWT